MPKIINLSQRILNDNEINLLKRGLKFTPTPQESKEILNADISDFCRKLRLSYIFNEKDEDEDDDDLKPLVRNKSNWKPKVTKDKHLEETIALLKTKSLDKNNNIKENLSPKERKAVLDLKSDKSIIIKEADKGSAIVILDRDYYREKILNMLTDNQYYEMTDKTADKKTRKLIEKLFVKDDNGVLDEEQDYITNFAFTESYFYGLPKIHKSQEISNAISSKNSEYIEILRPDDLTFRPIVGGPNNVTQRLSNFIDIILKPLCQEVPSFIRDDLDFLTHLPEIAPVNSELITFDVVSLYTNIPHDLGLSAVKFWLEKKCHLIQRNISESFILSSLKIILENNVFYFDGLYYKQKKGTAMGTKVAPTYATLVLGYLEHQLISTITVKYGESFATYIRNNWKRFLDDCFILWNTDISVENFHSELNGLNEHIQFTMNRSKSEMPFLDVLVKITENNYIETDLYSKTTDSHLYLNFNSCHPKHTKLNIPFNLASRIVSIVNTEETRDKRLSELKSYLQKQCYPEQLINFGISKALEKGPIQTSNRQSEKQEVIPFVTTYNPRNFNIFGYMKQIENNLKLSQTMDNVLQKKKIINSKRQSKNLKRILSSSKFDSIETTVSVQKCSDKRCKTCPDIVNSCEFTFKNGKHFKLKQNISCKTKNVIYSIICKNCDEFYVGETRMELKARMTLHRQQTNNPELTILRANEHFRQCSGGHFRIFPLYKVYGGDSLRGEKEKLLINLLKPGLNDK